MYEAKTVSAMYEAKAGSATYEAKTGSATYEAKTGGAMRQNEMVKPTTYLQTHVTCGTKWWHFPPEYGLRWEMA